MKDKKMKFHILLTNKETGETIHDYDCNAVIGAIRTPDSVAGIGLTGCNPLDMASTLLGVKVVTQKLLHEHPELKALMAIIEAMKTESEVIEETQEPEETENN